jgi:diaminopimelate decarboxylase
MDYFTPQNGVLHAENCALPALAERFGTPLYVYSQATLERHYRAFASALASVPHQICYAVKANSSLGVLAVLAKLGSGFDIVSGGELFRVLQAGGQAGKTVFSGVGKTREEMAYALEVGVGCFNVESESELHQLHGVAAKMGKVAHIALRVNPDVDPQTHPYISTGLKENKFGVALSDSPRLYRIAAGLSGLKVVGMSCHIGSQLLNVAPIGEAIAKLLKVIDALAAEGIVLEHLDVGGGLGVRYLDEQPTSPQDWAAQFLPLLQGRKLTIFTEPGRAIAGNAGVLLMKTLLLKENEGKHFAVVDAAMNDLLRPTLYEAWMDIVPVQPRSGEGQNYDVVGPVCESGDWLGKDRLLCLEEGDLLAVRTAGAYGFSMASNYNSRPRPAEVLVQGSEAKLIRVRETWGDLVRGELC